jgi:hypothetical protein
MPLKNSKNEKNHVGTSSMMQNNEQNNGWPGHVPRHHVATATLPGQDGLIELFGVKLNGIMVRMVAGGHIARLVKPFVVIRAIPIGQAAEWGGDQRHLQYFFCQQVERPRRHLLRQ